MKAAQSIESIQPALEYGVIAVNDGESLLVNSDCGLMRANVAVSCLVSPEVGDIVLISLDGAGCCYILSILERSERSSRKTELAFEGDVDLNVRGGSMTITSDQAIALASRDLGVDAQAATIRIDRTSFFGRLAENHIAKLRLVAESVDSIVRRAVQRFTSSYRYVEDHEEIQSASTRMIVDGTLTMHTKNTMHIAEGHVKIDAEQIHLA
jgi:hypothetical protein